MYEIIILSFVFVWL